MNSMHYLGLDVPKKTISACFRQADGTILQEGTIAATGQALGILMECLPQAWVAGLEATMFSAWIYDEIRARWQREGGTFNDAASDRSGQAQERPVGRPQARGSVAMQLLPGMPHGGAAAA